MRLFDCEPTDRERSTLHKVNRSRQGILMEFDRCEEPEPVCPACAGVGDRCTCPETGAAALELFG